MIVNVCPRCANIHDCPKDCGQETGPEYVARLTNRWEAELEAARTEGGTATLSSIRASLEAWPSAGCDIGIAKAVVAIRDAAVKAEREKFGVGPHLLTAKDGSQALCGGPGVCPACDHRSATTFGCPECGCTIRQSFCRV
jgi:hypothetical protein